MNLRKTILTMAATLLLLAGLSTSNVGAADNLATVSIITGPENIMTVVISSAVFTATQYSLQDTTTTSTVTVTPTDLRGTAAGWNVNLSATDLSRDASTNFAISNLSLVAGELTGPGAASITKNNAAPVQKTGVSTTKILSAPIGSGMGAFVLTMAGTLTIPGGTLIGLYTSTMTVTIATGP